jgi:hypothetical protein
MSFIWSDSHGPSRSYSSLTKAIKKQQTSDSSVIFRLYGIAKQGTATGGGKQFRVLLGHKKKLDPRPLMHMISSA